MVEYTIPNGIDGSFSNAYWVGHEIQEFAGSIQGNRTVNEIRI